MVGGGEHGLGQFPAKLAHVAEFLFHRYGTRSENVLSTATVLLPSKHEQFDVFSPKRSIVR